MDLDGLDSEDDSSSEESDTEIDMGMGEDSSSDEQSLFEEVLEFCGGPDLVEVFGPSGSGKSVFTIEVMKSAMKDEGKNALFVDTERNVGSLDEIEGADYVYIPEWNDIYNYCIGQGSLLTDDSFGEKTHSGNDIPDGYDIVVLDSIGFPALVQYGEYRVANDADQFKVFNELQVITGRLKQYAQRNNALVIVINQPKSDLSDADDPGPFGDKSIFGFKEVWKTDKLSSNETKTTCNVNAFRSRQKGKGTSIYEVEIDDNGVNIKFVANETGGGFI